MIYLKLLMRCSGAKLYIRTPDLATLQLMSSRMFSPASQEPRTSRDI
jgi:hypothetical protein